MAICIVCRASLGIFGAFFSESSKSTHTPRHENERLPDQRIPSEMNGIKIQWKDKYC